MPHMEWNDRMRMELLRLKAELKPDSLKNLSSGLGFGRFSLRALIVESAVQEGEHATEESSPSQEPVWKPLGGGKPSPSLAKPLWKSLDQVTRQSAKQQKPHPTLQKNHQKTKTRRQDTKTRKLKFLQYSILIGVDSVFVFSSSVMALLFYRFISGQKSWWSLSGFLEVGSSQYESYADVPLFPMFCGLVGISYFILFRFLLGGTLGQMMARPQSLPIQGS